LLKQLFAVCENVKHPMTYKTAKEAKTKYIESMGNELGSQYAQLWQEVVYFHLKWAEFVVLFGTKPSRIKLMNMTAPAFFRTLQDVLYEETLLHITRLTDPPKTGFGKNKKSNLTIMNFKNLVTDTILLSKIEPLLDALDDLADFCRDWRNRRIAHRDLEIALEKTIQPLKNGSRLQVDKILEAIANVMNEIAAHYLDTSTHFKSGSPHGGAFALLHYIDAGKQAEKAKEKRWRSGNLLQEDLEKREI
jgi:hypothetical protein